MILQKLHDVGFYAKLEKCVFYQTQVEFLDYIISREGFSMDPKKVSDHHGMDKVNVNLRFLMFFWFCKLLSTFYLRLFKGCYSIRVPYLQRQA